MEGKDGRVFAGDRLEASFRRFMKESEQAGHMLVCVAAEPGLPPVAWVGVEKSLDSRETLFGAYAMACRALAASIVGEQEIPALLEACAEWTRQELAGRRREVRPAESYAEAAIDGFDGPAGPMQ